MARNTAELIIKAVDQASSVLQKIGTHGSKNLSDVKTHADLASKSMDYLKTAAYGAAVGFGMKGAWDWLIKSNAAMEQAQIGFETMLKSADRAKSFLGELQDFAARTPFEFTELRTATSRLLAMGFAAEEILPMMTAIGDATSGLGLGADGIDRVTLALGQMRAKTKVSSQEMLQLTETGIPAWEILAESMGKTTAEVMKLAERGLIPADEAIQSLVQGMEERFPKMMEKQAKTMGGMLSNLKEYVEMAGLALGKGTFDQIKPMIENAAEGLERLQKSGQLEKWGHNIGQAMEFAASHTREFLAVAAGFGAVKAFQLASLGAAAATKFFSTMVVASTGQLATNAGVMGFVSTTVSRYRLELALASAQGAVTTGVFTRLNIAFAALSKTMLTTPVGLVLTGLGLAIGAYALYKTKIREVADETERYIQTANQESEAQEQKVKLIESQIASLQDLSDKYVTLKTGVDAGTLSENDAVKAKDDLVRMENQLIPIIGQEGVARINTANNTREAFNSEINGMKHVLENEKAMINELIFAEDERTRQHIDQVNQRINALAVGAMAQKKFGENLRNWWVAAGSYGLEPDQGAAAREYSEQLARQREIVDLEKERSELISKLRFTPSTGLGSLPGGLVESLNNAGAAAGNAAKSLISFGSVFSAVASASGSQSDEAFVQAKDALQDLAAAAEKAGSRSVMEGVKQALTLLPQSIYDETGETGKRLLWLLYSLFQDAGDLAQEAGHKIVNAHDIAMARIEERLKQAREKAAEEAARLAQQVADALARAGDLYADMNERLAEANADYQERFASINEKLSDDIKRLREDYNQNVDKIIDKYKNWIGLFDEAPKRQWVSATKMLRYLRVQNQQFQEFYSKLDTLSARGVDEGLIEELRAMGPKALPYIQAMTRMTDAQLVEYVALWQQKGSMAGDAAAGEIEEARQEMLTMEQKMRADAKKELDRLYQEWKKQTDKIRKDTTDKLGDIAKNSKDQGKNFMANLLDGIAAQYPAFKTMIDKIKADMDLGTTGGAGNKTVEQMSEEEIGELVRQIVASKQHLGASYSGNGIVSMFDYAKGEGYDVSLAEFLARYGSDSSSWSGSGGSGTTGSGSGGSSGGPGSGGTGAAKEQPKYIFTPEGYRMIGDTAAVWARRFENYGYAVDWDAARGQVIVNGKRFTPLDIDSDDHAWVSLRQVFEAMGRRVEWDSSNGNVNVYHKGGQVSKLGPKEVPIVAEEGELIVPAGYNVVNLEKVFSRGIDRLIKELRELLPVRVEKLQQAENIHIHKQVDLERNNRKLAREILLMAGR